VAVLAIQERSQFWRAPIRSERARVVSLVGRTRRRSSTLNSGGVRSFEDLRIVSGSDCGWRYIVRLPRAFCNSDQRAKQTPAALALSLSAPSQQQTRIKSIITNIHNALDFFSSSQCFVHLHVSASNNRSTLHLPLQLRRLAVDAIYAYVCVCASQTPIDVIINYKGRVHLNICARFMCACVC